MTFYAVTKGSYSDYHIITITTDKEKAEFLAKKFSDGWGEARVEEYIENELMLKPLWEVCFDTKGNIVSVTNESSNDFLYNEPDIRVNRITNYVYILVSTYDGESAIKIAAEKRAEFLAREEGIV